MLWNFSYIFNIFTKIWYLYAISDHNIISRSFYYASFVMSRRVDSNFPDVCRKVIKCNRVVAAIKQASDEEFNDLQEEEAGIQPFLSVITPFL